MSRELIFLSFNTFSLTYPTRILNSFSNAVLFSDIFFAFSFRSKPFFNTRWGGREVSVATGGCGLATDGCGLAVDGCGMGTEVPVVQDLNLLPEVLALIFTWLLAVLLLQKKKPNARRRIMQRTNPPMVAKPWDEFSKKRKMADY